MVVGLVAVLVGQYTLHAQQLPEYSNYMLNNYMINPAVAGTSSHFEAVSTNRYQWVGIVDAPRTNILSVNGPLSNDKMGVGGSIYTDIVGPTRRIGMNLSYAYHLQVTSGTVLSGGVSAGLLQFTVDGDKIQLRDPSDLVLTNDRQRMVRPDVGFGLLWYDLQKLWYVGVSIPQTLQSRVKFDNAVTDKTSNLHRHIYVNGGYKYYLSGNYAIEPSVLMKYSSPAPFQFNFGARFIYQDRMWIGAMYRSGDAFAALLGYEYQERFRFGYSYDFTTSNLRNYSDGTHELLIAFKFHNARNGNSASVSDEESESESE